MADLTDEIDNAEYDGVIYNNKYTNTITRQSIINNTWISDEQAANLIHRLFYDYERIVLQRFVLVEKINNKQYYVNKANLREMLLFYNMSLKKIYKIRANFSEGDVFVLNNKFHERYVHMRFVMVEKTGYQGTTPSGFDCRTGQKRLKKDRCGLSATIQNSEIENKINNEDEGTMWLKICEDLF